MRYYLMNYYDRPKSLGLKAGQASTVLYTKEGIWRLIDQNSAARLTIKDGTSPCLAPAMIVKQHPHINLLPDDTDFQWTASPLWSVPVDHVAEHVVCRTMAVPHAEGWHLVQEDITRGETAWTSYYLEGPVALTLETIDSFLSALKQS